MASIRTTLELANQQFMAALKQSSDGVKNLQQNVQSAGGKFTEGFGKMNVAAGALAATLIGTGKAVMSFADEMSDVAAAHQTTIAQVVALGAALQANGGKVENAGKMFFELSKSINEALGGNLKTARNLAELGVSIQDLGSLSETQIRNKLIKNLAEIEDPSIRAAKAFEIFGKSARGVDFLKLAADIEENSNKYAKYERSLKTAGDAQDNLAKILMDIKIAFAQAFEPVFKIIAGLNPDIESLTKKFQLLGIAVAVIGTASVISGVVKLTEAMILLGLAVGKNKILVLAGVLAAAGIGIAEYTGLIDKLTGSADENTSSLNDQLAALQQGNDARRDTSNLAIAYEKESSALKKITESYTLNNQELRNKLDLELKNLTQSESGRRASQQTLEMEQASQKTLIDLKNQYMSLDGESRKAQKATYEEQVRLIEETAAADKRAAIESIKNIETRKQALADLTDGLKIRGKAEEEIFKLQQSMVPRNERDTILNNEEVNKVLQRRQVLLEWIVANKANISLQEIGEGLLQNAGSAAEFNTQIQDAIDKIRLLGETDVGVADLFNSVSDQLLAIDQATTAVSRAKLDASEAQRTFSYGWEKAFNEYADNATNSSKIAENLFKKATQGMEDAIVKFAKTGKFEWKNFLNMMLEELLRAQIQQVFAQLLGTMGLGGRGGGGGGGLLGGLLGGGGGGARGGAGAGGKSGGGLLGGLLGGAGKVLGGIGGSISKGLGNLFGGGSLDPNRKTEFNTMEDLLGSLPGRPTQYNNMEDLLGSLPGNAAGGPVFAGRASIVGERGPELFVPSDGGSIIPNNQMGGSNVTYNINAVDAMSFKQMIARDPQFIYALSMQGARSMPGAR
jgi:hypothetical protein